MINAIEADGLSFSYGNEPILDKIGFSVCEGDFVSIIGMNGSGKSTLLKLILGEIMPNKGEIKLFGKPTEKIVRWNDIGYVPQNLASFANFPATAQEVVKANLFSHIGFMRFARKDHKQSAINALEAVGMGEYADKLIGNLSGGQLQRVMIARALVSKPKIIILDEPTAGVDYKAAHSLYELLFKLNKKEGITVVMVTHDMQKASVYSNRMFCIEEGSLVELEHEQLEDEIRHKHKHPRRNHNGHFSI